jgi:hypothetical protein
MNIMPAGVHAPGISAGKGVAGLFNYGQSVHIGTYADDLTSAFSLKEANHRRFPYSRIYFAAGLTKRGRYRFLGFEFLKGYLGMLV